MKRLKYLKKCFSLLLILVGLLFFNTVKAQSITGKLTMLHDQTIKLEGFNGLKSYTISTTTIDNNGTFKLDYKQSDFGVGYLISADEKPLFVILSGEEIEITGTSLIDVSTINIQKGEENFHFQQYAKEHPRREQSLSAWIYLEKMYSNDSLFSVQKKTIKAIQNEKKRITKEDAEFLAKLPAKSYVSWYLPIRKLVSEVSIVAQYRPWEIPYSISNFRKIDYSDQRLYKSGLFKDAIESHFWLLENSGKSIDSVFIEMKKSIDFIMITLVKDERKLNEVTDYLFDLLERHSLFQAAEYLALKVLNEVSCTIDSDLAKQLESYRTMKKGNIAPEIQFGNKSYLNGVKQTVFQNLGNLQTPYTLVVFGASWCPKCKEEMPLIINNYVKWRNLGVEVVYISLDEEPTEFEKTLVDLPFFAYCDFNKWNSQIVKDYYVFGTPTLYLLDKKREIILRPNSSAQVDAWVDWFLAEKRD